MVAALNPRRYVLYSDDAGVYLGSCMGMGFWSKWDAVGQPAAATFASPEDVQEWYNTIDDPEELPTHRLVEVEADDGEYATMESCIRSGLPAWDTGR